MSVYSELYGNFVFNIITEMVPYVRNLGLQPVTIQPGKICLEMQVDRGIHNHVNTAHAGALYTFLETLAGGVLVASFDIVRISVLLKAASIEYLYPGLGRLTGEARLEEQTQTRILDELRDVGKSKPVITASLSDSSDRLIATGTFIYSLNRMG